MRIFLILSYVSFGSIFLPTMIGLISYKHLSKTLRILSVFCILKALLECMATYLASYSINNMYLSHLYTPIQFVSIILIFATLYNSRKINFVVLPVAAIFCVFCVVNAIYFQTIENYNTFPQGIQGIVVIIICAYFFYELINSPNFIDLTESPYFWMFSGWLLYFSGTLFLFIYSYHGAVSVTYYMIHSVLNIFLNLVFTYALWLGRKSLTT